MPVNGPRNVREVAPFFFPPGTADHRPRREVVRCPAPTGRPPPTTGGRSCPASGARSLAATTPGCRARPRRRETGETRRGPVPPRRPCCGRSLPVSTREVAARRRPQDGRRPPPARGASPPSTGGRRVTEDERPLTTAGGRPLGMRDGRPAVFFSGRPPAARDGNRRTLRRICRELARRMWKEVARTLPEANPRCAGPGGSSPPLSGFPGGPVTCARRPLAVHDGRPLAPFGRRPPRRPLRELARFLRREAACGGGGERFSLRREASYCPWQKCAQFQRPSPAVGDRTLPTTRDLPAVPRRNNDGEAAFRLDAMPQEAAHHP